MIKTKWKRSNLHKGERIRIQESLLTVNGDRFTKAVVDGETDYGIRLNLFFEPGPLTEENTWNYKVFIDWPAIYCGDVKLMTYDGKDVKAERLMM